MGKREFVENNQVEEMMFLRWSFGEGASFHVCINYYLLLQVALWGPDSRRNTY